MAGLEPVAAQAQTPPWRDTGVVSVNREPPHSRLDPLGPASDPDRWRLDLAGRWGFLYLDRAPGSDEDPATPLDGDPRWTEIAVPGSWQEQGFGTTELARSQGQNPVYVPGGATPAGVYAREFRLPTEWQGRRVILRLTRVRSSVSVYANGTPVGYSEAGDAGIEFDLSRHLVDAVNRLTLVVTQWSTSSEHNGTHWTDAGLVGEVELVALPVTHMHDLASTSRYDPESGLGTLDLRLWLHGSAAAPRGSYRLQVVLSNPEGEVVGRRFRSGIFLDSNHQATAVVRLRTQPVVPWSSDEPTLYTLELQLVGPDGSLLQRSSSRVGFRSFAIRADGPLINGRRETLRGVSLDADLPLRVGEPVAIRHHLELMKGAGINALRVPTALGRRWSELLDEYGFYALHDLRPSPLPAAAAPAGERARAMVEAAKNHTSTVAWVVTGGEAPRADDLQAWIRVHAGAHPVVPDATVQLVAKPRAWQLDRRAANSPTGLLLWPFGSLLGNSGGGLSRIWRIVEREPALIGGFLPQWMVSARTEGVLPTAESDAVARGLIDADGQPLPQYAVVADLYRRLRFEIVDPREARVRLRNRTSDFVDTGGRGLWELRQDGSLVAAGRLPHLGVGAGEAVEFAVPGLPPRSAAAEYHLTLSLPTDGIVGSTGPIAEAQFALTSEREPTMMPFDGEVPALAIDEDSSRVELNTRDMTFRVDQASGTLRYLALRRRPLINDVVKPALWRLPTQLERANGVAAVDRRLQPLFTGAPADWVGRRVSPGAYSAVSEYTLLDEGLMRIQTTTHGTGAVELSLHWLGEPGIADPPRLGATLPLGPRPASVEWFGRGPGESYTNRVAGTYIGRWQQSLPFENPYYWGQAHGLRTEVRWLTVWFTDGTGLMMVTPPSSSFSISNDSGNWAVDLDAQHRGVGGERDDAVPSRRARIPPGEYRATFLLLPLPAGSDPQRSFRSRSPTDETAAALGRPVRRPAWALDHLGRRRPLNLVETDADVPPTLRSSINDGWVGSVDAFDGSWQRIDSTPAEITIDLERVETVRRVRLGVLANADACTDLPAAVEFSYSTDRRRWVSLEPVRPEPATVGAPGAESERLRRWLGHDLLGRPVRWVRARILAPQTQCARGGPNHVLVDELVIE